jgi:putative salt-induced outer membrane protein YdiY
MKSRLLPLAIAATAALASGAAGAQTTQQADGQWRGSLGAGASFTSGNTRSTAANLNAEAIRLTSGDKTRLYGTAVYGKNNGVESANLFRAGGRYDYDLSTRAFAFGGLDMERDKIGNLKSRFAPSVGLGFNVIKNTSTTFAIFGGVGYAQDAFFRPVLIDGALRTNYGRAELLLGEESTHRISSTTSFRQRLVVYPNLEDTGAFRAVFDAGLAVAMSSRMSLTVGLVNRYNSDPGPGIKKSDTLFVTGIAVKID